MGPRVDAERLQASLMALAAIGATPGGGVTRLACSDQDRAGRDWLRAEMAAAGLRVSVDDLGNISGHRAGSIDEPPVLLGSHIDTVIRGGRYDGALGVVGALEVVRALNDAGVRTRRPLAMVSWTNEEGVRFEPAMQASGVLAGRFDLDDVLGRPDRAGLRFGDELRRIGYAGDPAERPLPASAYLELHIEQGPVLEAAGVPVGIVGGIVGITWLEVTLDGQADHAGPSPMRLRRDALAAAARVISGVERIARDTDEIAVATVGRLALEPNVINTIPGRVTFSVDFRHPDPNILEAQVAKLEALVAATAAETGVTARVERFWTSEPTPFAPVAVAAVAGAVAALELPARELWSGAGHDAKYASELCPSAMIFVRSRGGLSHCEAEYSTPADIAAGANVLLLAALALAGEADAS